MTTTKQGAEMGLLLRVSELESRLTRVESRSNTQRQRQPKRRCTERMPACMGMAARFECTCTPDGEP